MIERPYDITNIQWQTGSDGLPGVTSITLMVPDVDSACLNPIWLKCVAQARLSHDHKAHCLDLHLRPSPFGRFAAFVELSACMPGIIGFRPPVGDTIHIIFSQNSDGRVALDILEESLCLVDSDQWFYLRDIEEDELALTVSNYDLLGDAGCIIEDEWRYRDKPSDSSFGEHESPREHRVYSRGDEFVVSQIDWVGNDAALPSSATVRLPDWLVCAEEDAPDSEWNREINDQLQAKFGSRARWFTFARA